MDKVEAVYRELDDNTRRAVEYVISIGGVVVMLVTNEGMSVKALFMRDSIDGILTEIEVESEEAEKGFVWGIRPVKWKGDNKLETEMIYVDLKNYYTGGREELRKFLERHFDNVNEFLRESASNDME